MLSSAVEHFLHTEGVTGSIPVAPTIYFIALLIFSGSALAQPVPPGVPGNYVRTHANGTDTLSIRKEGSGLKVSAKFFFANGHSCTYEGAGGYARDRVITSDTDKGDCTLVLFFTPNRVHTVTQGECHQWCGARGTLDRAVLRKRTR